MSVIIILLVVTQRPEGMFRVTSLSLPPSPSLFLSLVSWLCENVCFLIGFLAFFMFFCVCVIHVCLTLYNVFVRVCACVCVFPSRGMVYWYLGISDQCYCYQQLWTNSPTLDLFTPNKSCVRKRGVTSHTNTRRRPAEVEHMHLCIHSPNAGRDHFSNVRFLSDLFICSVLLFYMLKCSVLPYFV